MVILIDLTPYYGLISVSGADAETFLQGQLTCDMRELSPTHVNLGAYCNLKGRIRALFKIFLMNNAYFLQLPIGLLPSILTQLKKYALFSKVTLKDESQNYNNIGVVGTDLKNNSEILFTVPNTNSISRFQILEPKNSSSSLLEIPNIQKQNFSYWKSLDIQDKIPEVWLETTEQLLPHYLNLPSLNAVSFKKGCYCGQEIIARMEYKAKIKRTLFYALLRNCDNEPLPGTKIYATSNSGEDIGTVVSATLINNNLELLIEAQKDSMINNHFHYDDACGRM